MIFGWGNKEERTPSFFIKKDSEKNEKQTKPKAIDISVIILKSPSGKSLFTYICESLVFLYLVERIAWEKEKEEEYDERRKERTKKSTRKEAEEVD